MINKLENLLGKYGYVKANKLEISRVLSHEFDVIEMDNARKIKSDIWKAPKKHLKSPSHYNLTFNRHGSFIITGYIGKGAWQVRCQCGNYTEKHCRFFRWGEPRYKAEDCCSECEYKKWLKLNEDPLTTFEDKNERTRKIIKVYIVLLILAGIYEVFIK